MALNGLRRTGNATPEPPDGAEPGRVVNTPVDGTDDLFVVLDNFSTDEPVGPVLGWRGSPVVSWPRAGDSCLVVESDGAWWLCSLERDPADVPDPGDEVTPPDHIQSSPAQVWTINHGLGRRVMVSVLDSSGKERHAAVAQPDTNTAVVTFASAQSGRAVIR